MSYATGLMPNQTPPDRPSEIASLGGKARAKALTKDERSSIASHAVSMRWNRELPRATHSGEFVIGDKRIACGVLETGKRLLTRETFLSAIGEPAGFKAIDGMPAFIAADNLKPFIPDQLRESTTPIFFRDETGGRRAGYDASLLPMVCEVYLQLRDRYLARGTPIPSGQAHIITACEMLTPALAAAGGIFTLIDKATGYQADRVKEKLVEILETSVADELQPWICRFPQEFFLQVYRLQGREFEPGSDLSPADIALFIDKYIYEQLSPDVASGLSESSPMAEKRYRRQRRLRSLIANTGNPHLDQQISIVTTLLKIARNTAEFHDLFNRAFAPKEPMLVILDA